jgi:cytosine/adenosine deaminase-related metal-dependent hydrolase
LNESKILLNAAWVAPIDSPIIRDGAIFFEKGRIAGIGAVKALRAAHPDAILHDAGNSVVLPGLINPHTHLELSGCVAGDAPASFTDWIASIPDRVGPNRDFATAARAGAAQSLRFGVTSVGDISQQCHLTRPALRDGPLRVVSYGEVLGIGGTRYKVDELLARALDESSASERMRAGLSPHATYSLDWKNYIRIAQASHELPIATHLAELPYERDFLEHRTGPLRDFLERMGIWQDDIKPFTGGPIDLAKTAGLLDTPTLLAHVNYCDDRELAMLSAGKATVVYCPRTHRYFGHPPHRWRDMLTSGINVAVGTDSCASSPDLNLVDDLRLLHEIAPEVPAHTLWEMATLRAARAIQTENNLGSLTIGKAADVAVFPVMTNDPLLEILEAKTQLAQVWIDGQLMSNHPAWHG